MFELKILRNGSLDLFSFGGVFHKYSDSATLPITSFKSRFDLVVYLTKNLKKSVRGNGSRWILVGCFLFVLRHRCFFLAYYLRHRTFALTDQILAG